MGYTPGHKWEEDKRLFKYRHEAEQFVEEELEGRLDVRGIRMVRHAEGTWVLWKERV